MIEVVVLINKGNKTLFCQTTNIKQLFNWVEDHKQYEEPVLQAINYCLQTDSFLKQNFINLNTSEQITISCLNCHLN